MNGLKHIPQTDELLCVYNKFLTAEKAICTDELTLWAHWSRFDPRLAEIWIEWVVRNWSKINATEWGSRLTHSTLPWPQTVGVLLEMSQLQIQKKEISIFR